MIEVLREPSQSNLTLLFFLGVVLVYVFLYNNDSRRLVYFFRSLYNKQYQVNYGRYNKVLEPFHLLISLTSLVSASFLLSFYLKDGSWTPFSGYLFIDALLLVLVYLAVKWFALFISSVLFKSEKLFLDFMSLSVHYANLFFTPITILMVYFYLIDLFSLKHISILLSIALVMIVLARLKTYIRIRNEYPLGFLVIILYLCVFEIAPFLWLLIGLNC